jgi:MOSC domain-containing protein YiiM
MAPGPHLIAVNVLHAFRPGRNRLTGIDKRPVDGPVALGALGLAGDAVGDERIHGGVDQALYAYAVEDMAWWARQLGREIAPGLFGDNLTTAGVDVTNAVIGERWRIGTRDRGPTIEVRMPRVPCANFTERMQIVDWHTRFKASGRVGAYLAVVEAGTVAAGDAISVTRRPSHGVTIADASAGDPDVMRVLLDGDAELAEKMRRAAERVLARAR